MVSQLFKGFCELCEFALQKFDPFIHVERPNSKEDNYFTRNKEWRKQVFLLLGLGLLGWSWRTLPVPCSTQTLICRTSRPDSMMSSFSMNTDWLQSHLEMTTSALFLPLSPTTFSTKINLALIIRDKHVTQMTIFLHSDFSVLFIHAWAWIGWAMDNLTIRKHHSFHSVIYNPSLLMSCALWLWCRYLDLLTWEMRYYCENSFLWSLMMILSVISSKTGLFSMRFVKHLLSSSLSRCKKWSLGWGTG